MNYWQELSIEFANSRNYLDALFSVYPTVPNELRDIDNDFWELIERAFYGKDNDVLIQHLLNLDLFPIKDSYVAFLKRDKSAISRNPKTIARLCGRLYEIGLDKIYERCSEPKETNRQIGPLFKRWLRTKALGIMPVSLNEFLANNNDAILDASDKEMQNFAKEHLNYQRNKGLDFIARFSGKYVIGEAKFLSDFGGHQDAQLEDAILTLTEPNVKAIKVAILDGVVWLKTNNKMYKMVTEQCANENIMSALVLREFLYSL